MIGSSGVDFTRATPPKTPLLSKALTFALGELSTAKRSLEDKFRVHRFGGTDRDRAAAMAWLSQRLPIADAGRVIVTNGTMNSIFLLLLTIVGRGNTLLVEELTFPQVHRIAGLVGVNVVPVKIDSQGILPSSFEDACEQFQPRAFYCNPTIQSPTASILPYERRLQVAQIARRSGVILIEDEAQALYCRDAPPPIASIAPEATWYLMGLSKYLSLGIRVAYIIAPSSDAANEMIEAVGPLSTWHPSPILAEIVDLWIETGLAVDILRATRSALLMRQRAVHEVLGGIGGFRGSDGLHFWLGCPPGQSGDRLAMLARSAGVAVRSSSIYSPQKLGGRLHGVRPAVGDPRDVEAVRRGCNVLSDVYADILPQ